MPYTVFHLDGERGLRGGERQLLYLAESLRARGHRNIVVCRRGAELEREARARGLEVLPLPFSWEWDPVTAWRLRREVTRHARPVLHAHTAHAAALALAAGAGTDAVRVVHRRVDFPLRGGLSLRVKYASAHRVIAITEGVRRVLEDCGLVGSAIAVVPSAVPPDLPEKASGIPREQARAELAAELGLDPAAPWIGMLAAFVPHKDPENLLRAFRLVLDKRPDAVLLLAGEGPLEPRLRELAGALRLGRSVRFLGWRRDNLRLLRALDVFALPSALEGMGSVLLEAAACGTPVAATRAGGIPEAVADGDTGLLAPPRDPEALAANLLRLLDDRALAGRLAQAGRERLKGFTTDRLGERTEAVYRELLDGR